MLYKPLQYLQIFTKKVVQSIKEIHCLFICIDQYSFTYFFTSLNLKIFLKNISIVKYKQQLEAIRLIQYTILSISVSENLKINIIIENTKEKARDWFKRIEYMVKEENSNIKFLTRVIITGVAVYGEILQYAEQNSINLIVIGTKGKSGFKNYYQEVHLLIQSHIQIVQFQLQNRYLTIIILLYYLILLNTASSTKLYSLLDLKRF